MTRLRISVLLLATLCIGEGIRADTPDIAAQVMAKPSGNILDEASHSPNECTSDGVAVGGYDLISYHSDDGPRLGQLDFHAEHGGLTYLFESAANRDRFLEDRDKYLPAYSGWCAMTLALGRLTCPSYANFKIENGELLLFEVTGFTNGRTLWNTDSPGYRRKANRNYDLLMHQ